MEKYIIAKKQGGEFLLGTEHSTMEDAENTFKEVLKHEEWAVEPFVKEDYCILTVNEDYKILDVQNPQCNGE